MRERERERERTGPFGRETGHSCEMEKQKYKHMLYESWQVISPGIDNRPVSC